jgi:phosphomevalonate kinase
MISGEYAVLEGAISIVASVAARAYIALTPVPADSVSPLSPAARDGSGAEIGGLPQRPPLPPEAVLARRLAEEQFGAVNAELSIDASELRRSGKKLGLGSSAAASAAAVGAVLASHGQDLSDPRVQRRVFELALAGHKAIAPEGSGADVAAASLGGFVRYRLEGGEVAEAESVTFPAQVETRVVWTGKEARTSEFVRAVRQFEGRDAQGYARIRDHLAGEARRFADAIQAGAVGEIIAAAAAYGKGMGELGEAAGVGIVTAELAQIAELARVHGGAAKPSGAGGGDVAIAFFQRVSDAQAFDNACDRAGLERVDLGLGAPGVRAEND